MGKRWPLLLSAVGIAAAGFWYAARQGRSVEAGEGRILERNPPARMAHELGEAAFERGDLTEARRGFETAARLEPRSAMAWLNLGLVEGRQGERAPALEALRKAASLQPRWGLVWQNLADVDADDGQLDAAALAAERATRFAPRSPDAWIMRGHVALLQGRYPEAERFARRAVKLSPGRAECWLALGDSLLGVPGSSRAEEAAEAFRRAATLQQTAYVYRRLGEAQQRAGHSEQAIASLRLAARLAPSDAAPPSALAQALLAAGKEAEGRHWAASARALQERRYRLISLERRAQQEPGDLDLQSRLAREYAAQGDRQAAIRAFQRVLALRPEDAETRRTLARLEAGANR